MKKYKPYIIGFIITILLEIIVFNFSTWTSLGNTPIDLSSRMEMDMNEEGFFVHINDIDEYVDNVHFDIEIPENCPVKYDIALTDEGNYYDYFLPSDVISSKTPSSFYANLHPYGKVKTLTFTFNFAESAAEKLPYAFHGITINAKRPFMFNIGRVLLLYMMILFFGCVKDKEPGLKAKKISTVVVITVLILFGLMLSSSHKLLNEASKPHHQQYKELANSLSKGEVALDYIPEEGLIKAPNPYDTIYLQANQIDYRADYAYYDGKYYVYFGIVPEILIYFPYHIITGGAFPNHFAVFIFYALFVLGSFLLIYEIKRKYVPLTTWVSYLLIASSTVLCGTYTYIYFTADLYSVPLMAALAFLSIGLYFWFLADRIDSVKKKALYLCIGSLCMALVSGCRPQMLLFSFLAVPVFFDTVIKKRDLFSKKSIGRSVSFLTPYVIVAIGVMYYNCLRFGSVFDFGATYSLTNNDMNLRGMSISRMILGLGTFLFQPPYVNGVFPYLHTVNLEYSYLGRMVTEHFLGGIITCNVLLWNLGVIGHYKNTLKAKKLRLFFIMSVSFSLVIGLLDANTAGVLQRYTADIAFGIVLSSAVLWLVMCEKKNPFVFSLLKAGFFVGVVYTLMVIFNDASGITLKVYNPELFYQVKGLFRF